MPKKSARDSDGKKGSKPSKKENKEVPASPQSENPEESKSEGQAYIEKMHAERGYILGWHKILAERDFEFLKGYNGLLEAAYTNPRTLDPKTKEMVITAVLMAVRSSPEHIKTHIEMCKQLGVSEQEMLEVMEVMLPPAGVPAFMHSFELWRQVYNIV